MLPFLKTMFKFAGSINQKKKYYQYTWVSVKDFRDFLSLAGLLSEHFGEKDCYLAFLLSMMTQVDELYQARHYQMNFYEFIEALARVAEKASIILPKGKHPEQSVPDFDSRRHLPLHPKLEGLLMHIYFKLGEQIKQFF
jgi:hypothetical protein